MRSCCRILVAKQDRGPTPPNVHAHSVWPRGNDRRTFSHSTIILSNPPAIASSSSSKIGSLLLPPWATPGYHPQGPMTLPPPSPLSVTNGTPSSITLYFRSVFCIHKAPPQMCVGPQIGSSPNVTKQVQGKRWTSSYPRPESWRDA